MTARAADLLLASRSPQRAQLLEQLGVSFRVTAVEIDEAVAVGENPRDYVLRLATAKARAAWQTGSGLPALGADTAVVSGAAILGKPAEDSAAAAMLAALSGGWHDVYTAVTVCSGTCRRVCVVSRVRFRTLGATEIAIYVGTGEPRDKAGAYGIQGLAGAFVERLEGSYSAVVGLPLCETAALLSASGVAHSLRPRSHTRA